MWLQGVFVQSVAKLIEQAHTLGKRMGPEGPQARARARAESSSWELGAGSWSWELGAWSLELPDITYRGIYIKI